MSETKFRPAPWVWSNILEEVPASSPEACELVAYGTANAAGDRPIDTVLELRDEFSIAPADAHLIAVAPDLYAALEEVERKFSLLYPHTVSAPGWVKIREVLAKARGESI